MSSELNKHTFSTLLFVYSATFFLIFMKNFSSSSNESAIALFVFLFLSVVVYYMYEHREKSTPIKILYVVAHIILSLATLVLINGFDFKVIIFLMSMIFLDIYFIFYNRFQRD